MKIVEMTEHTSDKMTHLEQLCHELNEAMAILEEMKADEADKS